MKRILVGLMTLVVIMSGFSMISYGEDTEYVVVFNNEALPADYEQLVAEAGGQVISANPEIGSILVKSNNAPSMKARLSTNPLIKEIGKQGTAYLDDPEIRINFNGDQISAEESYYEMFQWDIKRVGGNPSTWALEKGNHSVIIGIVDTGVDSTHPDISANYIYGKSFVPGWENAGEDLVGHGTFVAGTVAGSGKIMGVGPGLGVASYRVFGDQPETGMSIVAKAIVTAANDGVKILNLSLGAQVNVNDSETRAEVEEITRAVKYAQKKGVILIAAAGNEALNLDRAGNVKDIPGDIEGVIAVSATTKSDSLAFYSNFGASIVDCSAPGGDLGSFYVPGDDSTIDFDSTCFGIIPNGGYAYTIGTSMAAPKVSAIIGLLASHYPDSSPGELNSMLQKSAIDLGDVHLFGNGLVDAWQSLNFNDKKS